MSKKPKKRDGKIAPAFDTQAISDRGKKLPDSGIAIPPEASVKEAKDWVAHNEK